MILTGGKKPFLCALACCLLVFSCREIAVFEKNSTISNYQWNHNVAAEGTFNISDTAAAYNIYLVIRHTDAYNYNNIWLNVSLQGPGDTMYYQKVDLALGNDANGWYGTGMNDIWEVRSLINGRPRRFIKPGQYKFSITQIMRDNPLTYIMSAGLRVDKAQ